MTQDKNDTNSTWASVNDETMISTKSTRSNRHTQSSTTSKQKETTLAKKRPKSSEWSIRSQSQEDEEESVEQEKVRIFILVCKLKPVLGYTR